MTLTGNQVLKWGSAVGSCAVVLVTAVWSIGGLHTDTQNLATEHHDFVFPKMTKVIGEVVHCIIENTEGSTAQNHQGHRQQGTADF